MRLLPSGTLSKIPNVALFTARHYASAVGPYMLLLSTCFFGPSRVHISSGISIGSAVSAQLRADSPYTLQWATNFPLTIASSHVGSGHHHGS